ncbi:MAG TPA: hypothetical protein VIX91_27015 [Candidatus Acidoferrum sp.]
MGSRANPGCLPPRVLRLVSRRPQPVHGFTAVVCVFTCKKPLGRHEHVLLAGNGGRARVRLQKPPNGKISSWWCWIGQRLQERGYPHGLGRRVSFQESFRPGQFCDSLRIV